MNCWKNSGKNQSLRSKGLLLKICGLLRSSDLRSPCLNLSPSWREDFEATSHITHYVTVEKEKPSSFPLLSIKPSYSKLCLGCYTLILPGKGFMWRFLLFERLVPVYVSARKEGNKMMWLSNIPIVKLCESNFWKLPVRV